MRGRLVSFAVVFVVLTLCGWATRPLVAPAWREVRAREPALQADTLERSLGQGITFAILGGFRAVVADFLWLETYARWERDDLPGTQKMIDLVTTIDPRPLYFWINGARIIAYDMPHWRYRAAERERRLTDALRQRIDREQARAALELLERGLGVHPDAPLLLIEMANIHQRRLQDTATAAEYYHRAALQPDAPYYAGRIYAVLLEQLGRHQEAYNWLRDLYPTLPPDNPMANAPFVLDRIRRLERLLDIPEERRFQPAPP